MDSEGGVWSARWQAGKVIRLSPKGLVDVVIDFPTAWHMTCVVFGGALTRHPLELLLRLPGKNLDELYVTSARTDYNGEVLPDRSDGGALFVVRGLEFSGVERSRYAGKLSFESDSKHA